MFVGQVCHIEAAAPGGPRYNPNRKPEERRAPENLILLCYAHHKKTDDSVRFSSEILHRMKAEHEARYRDGGFAPPERVLSDLSAEIDAYWEAVSLVSRGPSDKRWFPMAIDSSLTHEAVLEETHKALRALHRIVKGLYVPDAGDSNWDLYHIGVPNWFTRLDLLLHQLSVLHLEQCLKNEPERREIQGKLEAAREALRRRAETAEHVD